MRVNKFFFIVISIFLISWAVFADEVFVAKAVKTKSNTAIKEQILHKAKQLMREFNNLIRTISVHHDQIISQIEDMAESQNFFAKADNKELALCAGQLEELCARAEKMRLEIEQSMKQAFKSRKK